MGINFFTLSTVLNHTRIIWSVIRRFSYIVTQCSRFLVWVSCLRHYKVWLNKISRSKRGRSELLPIRCRSPRTCHPGFLDGRCSQLHLRSNIHRRRIVICCSFFKPSAYSNQLPLVHGILGCGILKHFRAEETQDVDSDNTRGVICRNHRPFHRCSTHSEIRLMACRKHAHLNQCDCRWALAGTSQWLSCCRRLLYRTKNQ